MKKTAKSGMLFVMIDEKTTVYTAIISAGFKRDQRIPSAEPL